MTHFKIRCIGFVEILLKSLGDNPLVIDIMSRLVRLLLKTAPVNGSANGKIEVHTKLIGVVNKISKSRKTPQGVDTAFVCSALQDLHEVIGKTCSTSGLVSSCSQVSLFLVKTAMAGSVAPLPKKKKSKKANMEPIETTEVKICRVYESSLKNLLCQKRTRFTAKFMQDFMNRYPSLAFTHFASLLCDLIDLEKVSGVFQIVEAIRVVKAIMTSIPADFVADNKKLVDEILMKLVEKTAILVGKLEQKDRKRLKEYLNEYWEIYVCKRLQPRANCSSIVEALEKVEDLEKSSALAKIRNRFSSFE